MISFRNEVSSAENLIFDPDDMNDFNAFGCYFQNFAAKIVIGKGSYIAPNVGLVTANHVLTDLEQHQPGKDIVLGKNCWIGMNSTVLPGVVLGDHTVVGAGSVVTKSFPEGWQVIAGNPAKVIRKLEKPTENENQNTAYPHHGKLENAHGGEPCRRVSARLCCPRRVSARIRRFGRSGRCKGRTYDRNEAQNRTRSARNRRQSVPRGALRREALRRAAVANAW